MKKLLLIIIALWPSLSMAQASGVNLAWNAVTTYISGQPIPATSPVTYNMYRGLQSNGSDLVKIAGPITTTTYTDSTLTLTTQYYFAVTSVTGGIESAKSNILGVRLSDFIPSAPPNLRVVMAIP